MLMSVFDIAQYLCPCKVLDSYFKQRALGTIMSLIFIFIFILEDPSKQMKYKIEKLNEAENWIILKTLLDKIQRIKVGKKKLLKSNLIF